MKKRISLLFVLFLMIAFSMSISVSAASYKNAYRKVVIKFDKKYKDKNYYKCLYNLIYIDKDKKPELYCECKTATNYYREFYTLYSGKAKCFFKDDGSPFSSHSSLVFYQPKKNVFGFRCWDQGSISDVFRNIKRGKSYIIKKESYGRTGNINKPPLYSKYKWVKGKYSKKKTLKKLK